MPAIRAPRSRTSPSGRRPHGSPPGCRPPASAPSTTSWTSPTTCCSSSASRCTRSISSKLAGGELRIRRAKKGERIKTLDGADRALEPDMLVIADARQRAGGRRRHGRRAVRSQRDHQDDRARERLLQAEDACA